MWTGLSPDTEYTISTKTVDLSGNMDDEWVNATVTTPAATPGGTLILYGESDNSDVTIYRIVGGTWTTLRNGVAGGTSEGNAPYLAHISSSTTADQFDANYRHLFIFNTSRVADDVTVTDATLSVFGQNYLNEFESNPVAIGITPYTPTSNYLEPQEEDFDNFVDLSISTNVSNSSWTSNAWYNWTITNLTYINTTGWFTGMARISWDIDNQSPAWGSADDTYLTMRPAVYSGRTYDPYLLVTYTGSGEVTPESSFSVDKLMIRFPNAVTVTDTSTNTPTMWNLSYGDGTWYNTTSWSSPSHQYTKRGMYTLILTASNGAGSDDSDATTVKVIGYENYY
jgi:PKD repeat protein